MVEISAEECQELRSNLQTLQASVEENMRVENKLKENENNFRTFFNAVDTLIIVGTPDGKIVFANAAVTKKLGYSIEDLGNMHVLDLNASDKRAEAEAVFASMFKGELDVCSLPLQRKDGTLIPAETRVWLGKWNGADCIFGVSTDLSKEHEALQKFNRLFCSNPSPMAVNSINEGRFTDVNDAFLKMLGYTREEVIGKSSAELNIFPQQEKQQELAQQLETNGRITNAELLVRSKAGELLHGLFSGEVIDIQGKPFFLTVMIDQTENKTALEALKEKTLLLSNLLISVPDIIFFKDKQGVYLGCNPEFARVVGRDIADIIGFSDYDFFNKEIAEFFMEQDRMMMESGAPRHNDEWITYPDGRRILIDTYKAPLHDVDGVAIGILGVSRDITERKRIEETLRERESYLTSIIENQPGLVWLKDAESRFLAVNHAFARSCGLHSPDQLIGKNDFDVWPRELAEAYRADDAKVIALQKPVMTEEKIFDKGEYKWFETFKTPVFGSEGSIIGTTGYSHDITERKQAEEELKKLDEMKTEFIATVSHELRTPLAIIKEGISLVLDGVVGQINKEQEHFLSTAKRNINRLARIINSLLDISKIESGKLEQKNEPFDIVAVIAQVLASFDSQAKDKGLQLTADLPADGIWLNGDVDMVIRIFTNLVGNSLKFTEKGFVNISVKELEHEIECEVADSGIGISRDDLPKVFDKFQQFGRVAGGGEKGTGLGLSIVKGLVEAHNGNIRVESDTGLGTKFVFTLPKHRKETH